MGVKLLCTGDVHLGRPPSRLSDQPDPADLGPAAVWEATVDEAIARKVDAVMLTGDIVDKDNHFFESYAPLTRGVQRLVDAGIAVYAVAGNHDVDVVGRLAAEINGFRLLGKGGQWEETLFKRDGQPVLQIVGRSFSKTASDNTTPLAGMHLTNHGVPTVALLHCNLDGPPGDPYAPVARAALTALPVDAWLLGHIHKPEIKSDPSASQLILYPGSPQGLDPTETGAHGAWLIEIEPGSPPTATPLPLAALRWEQFDVPMNALSNPDDFAGTITRALKAHHAKIADTLGAARAVGCRLTLTGRTPAYRHLDRLIAELHATGFPVPQDGVDYLIDKITNAAAPSIDLAKRATRSDPAGLLAKRLVLLKNEEADEEYCAMLTRARAAIVSSDVWKAFSAIAPGQATDITDAELVKMLSAVGVKALDAMLAQKEAQP